MAARTSTRQVIAGKMAAGIGEKFTTKNDHKVCPDCASRAGKYVDKGGKGAPPVHPNCRCEPQNH